MLCYQFHFSRIFQFVSVLRLKKRRESSRKPEIQAINGERESGTDAAGNETAPRLSLQPQSAQAPRTANRLEFSRWLRQTVQEQIDTCRRLVDISESEPEELTYSSMVSLKDVDESCWTRQEEWKQVRSLSRVLSWVHCGCLLQQLVLQWWVARRGCSVRPWRCFVGYLCYLLGGAAGDFLSSFFQPESLLCVL